MSSETWLKFQLCNLLMVQSGPRDVSCVNLFPYNVGTSIPLPTVTKGIGEEASQPRRPGCPLVATQHTVAS
jgi:hypothetical protein